MTNVARDAIESNVIQKEIEKKIRARPAVMNLFDSILKSKREGVRRGKEKSINPLKCHIVKHMDYALMMTTI